MRLYLVILSACIILGSISGCEKKQKGVKYAGVYSDSTKAALIVMGDKPTEAMNRTHKLLLGLQNGLEFIVWVTETPAAFSQRDTIEPRITYRFAPGMDSVLTIVLSQFNAWPGAKEKMLLLTESLPDSTMTTWRKQLNASGVELYTIRGF